MQKKTPAKGRLELSYIFGGGERSCTAVRKRNHTSISERSCNFNSRPSFSLAAGRKDGPARNFPPSAPGCAEGVVCIVTPALLLTDGRNKRR